MPDGGAPVGRCCRHCGAPLVQRPGEKLSRFARRQFCSAACSSLELRAQLTPGRPCETDESRFAMSHAEIGARLGMSRQQVAHYEKRALEKMRRALRARGGVW